MEPSCSEYKAIVEASPNMVWRAGTDARCDDLNGTWLRFTGRSMEEETGDGWTAGVHPDDLPSCLKAYLTVFRKQESFEMEYRLRRRDGQWRWINNRGAPRFDASGSFTVYIGSCMGVTEKVEGRRLAEMAHNDRLTGLHNRNYPEYLLDGEFRKAEQRQTELALRMMDVDCFKFFSDHYGHSFGDVVLRQVAQKIAENLRKTDIAGRYGGDEFLVILSETTMKMAGVIAKRILDAVHTLAVGDASVGIGISIGIAGNADGEDARRVLEKAGQAMYRAKRAGGNRIRLD